MNKSSASSSWVLFWINPLAAALISLRQFRSPSAKNTFWAFCIFYGFTFAIGKESAGQDIIRYIEELQYLHSRYEFSIDDILNYFADSGEVDVLRTFLSYVISRVSDSQVFLTTVYAIIFGFFYSRNIFYVLSLLKGRIGLWEKLMIVGMILVIPIWMINGFRMWTAFHVFFYGLLPFIMENKKNKLIFIFLSFFVHFSFIVPISLFCLFVLLGSRLKLFFLGFIFTLFVSEINLSVINQTIQSFSPQILVERTENYTSESSIESREQRTSGRKTVWYVKWHRKLLRWSFYLIMVYFFFYADSKIRQKHVWRRLFSFTLIFFSIANLAFMIPSGGRFLNFAFFLSFAMALFYLNQFKYDFRFQKLLLVLSPAFVLFIVVAVRIGLYSISLTTIFGNPIIALLNIGERFSINDLIK